jgi:sugar phosphate isomerase/epimerase
MPTTNRRAFLQTSLAAASTGLLAGHAPAENAPATAPAEVAPRVQYRLGMVTYNMGKDMDLDQLFAFCAATGLEGVELRTTHKHGVEVELSPADRAAVRARFADSPVALAGLGSAFDFHAKEERVVRRNIDGAKEYAQLAADVGAPGIKLRPNALFDDEPADQTIARIGAAWREVAAFAGDLGVETRMEVHGRGTSDPRNIRKMIDAADHPNALVCWNSNKGEEDEHGSIRANFELLADRIALVHITDIGEYKYPWQELFTLLAARGYAGFCLAEIAYNPEPERFMRYYRTVFDLYTGQYRYPR